ncbi:MAG: DUF3307 domain-containing protein [Bacteroidales bacterium]|nr:DUF3307 domain-containing protein [Bacteroidales bacterium]
MDNAIIWLIRLLAAHLITDFVLQPDSWVKAKREKHLKAKEFWFHILLTTLVAIWFTCFEGWWWIALMIFVTHWLIDWWKSYQKDSIISFVTDQVLHLLVILIIWKIKFPQATNITGLFNTCITDKSFWIVLIALVFLTKPVGVIIGMITAPFREKIKELNENTLENAGTWIGILERVIIFFLVLINQWEAIGLLVAAKSIIRLKDGDQKMSEYVLIGTLISVSVAVITGFIVTKLI